MFSRTGVQVNFNGLISHAWESNYISSSSSSSSSDFGAIEFGGCRRITHNARLLGFQCLEQHELREERPMQAAACRAADAAAHGLNTASALELVSVPVPAPANQCYTSEGVEFTRVTVFGWDLRPVYEKLVKPRGQILHYNTRFSGLTEEDMVGVKTNLRDVQAALLARFSADTILLGHTLDSDLRALRLIHETVVDTAAMFPHRRGLPYKRALRSLMAKHLSKIIQNGVDGHDSQEDAAACVELMLWKERDGLKKGAR